MTLHVILWAAALYTEADNTSAPNLRNKNCPLSFERRLPLEGFYARRLHPPLPPPPPPTPPFSNTQKKKGGRERERERERESLETRIVHFPLEDITFKRFLCKTHPSLPPQETEEERERERERERSVRNEHKFITHNHIKQQQNTKASTCTSTRNLTNV